MSRVGAQPQRRAGYSARLLQVLLAVCFVLSLIGALATPQQTVQAQTFTFNPVADAYVDAARPSTNYGASTILRSLSSPAQTSYLRFAVQNLGGGAILSARLRVYANGSSTSGYEVYGVANNTWGERTLTAANAPGTGSRLGISGSHPGAAWTTVDLTSYITGEGTYSLQLSTTSSTSRTYASREAGANAPQLVLEVGTASTNTSTLTGTPTSTSTGTPTVTDTAAATATPTETSTPSHTSTDTPTNTALPATTGPAPADGTDWPGATQTAAHALTETAAHAATATDTGTPTETAVPGQTETNTPTPTASATDTAAPSLTPAPTASPTPTRTPTHTPPSGTDLSDALLLYVSSKNPSDVGFERVTHYYGLKLAELNLATTPLTDARLRDEDGAYYRTVHITGANLEAALDAAEQLALRGAVEGGLNLLVSALRQGNAPGLQALTGGQVLGSADVADTQKDYRVTTALPDVSRELSGLTITHASDPLDFALALANPAANTQVVVEATSSSGQRYALFARYQNGLGAVFIASNYADAYLKNNLLFENFYARGSGTSFTQQWFSQIMPLMMFVRHSAGHEAWHSEHDYANFTLDDPPLQANSFNYAGIQQEAQAHNFHFTLGLPPGRGLNRDAAVVELFRNHPAQLSIAMHGNNHDGYEFYKYSAAAGDPYPARPYAEQVADVLQGLSRLDSLTAETGLPYARSMIFPYNISPRDTLVYLKGQNFQVTLNSADVPLGMSRTRVWDAHMYAAEMEYANFGVILRYNAGSAPYPFDLFLDRPAWLYEHGGVFQTHGLGWFSPIADAVNNLHGTVEWRSIDEITRRLYLEKNNDDGSVDVLFYGRTIVVANATSTAQTYHVRREENGNVPLLGVAVAGQPAAYSVANGWFSVDVTIPAGSERVITLTYGPP